MDAKYDAIADWYDELVDNDNFTGMIIAPVLWQLIGDVTGKQVCDLACGQGLITRQLAKRDAVTTGIDLSAALIAIAREKSDSETINYIVDDAQTLMTIDDSVFDMVVCNLSLMDIPDLTQTLKTVRRVLKTDGEFIFSITHPCFEAPHAEWIKGDSTISRLIHTYADEGFWYSINKKGVRGQVGANHRTLATYINSPVNAGFVIERMVEPLMPQNTPEITQGHQVIPAFMVVRCRAL